MDRHRRKNDIRSFGDGYLNTGFAVAKVEIQGGRETFVMDGNVKRVVEIGITYCAVFCEACKELWVVV